MLFNPSRPRHSLRDSGVYFSVDACDSILKPSMLNEVNFHVKTFGSISDAAWILGIQARYVQHIFSIAAVRLGRERI